MLKEEFEDLIKRDVSDELYKDIEVVYNALPGYMDKLYFAGAILNDAGKAMSVLSALGVHICKLNSALIIEKEKIRSCAYDLIHKAHDEDDLTAREIAVKLIGERETVAYTIREDLPLWEHDKKFIMELMKEEGK